MTTVFHPNKEDLAPVSAQQLKDAWPTYLLQTAQAQRPAGFQPLPFSLTLRSGILHMLLGENVTPTDRQFEIMASVPVDGSVSKEEIQKRLAT